MRRVRGRGGREAAAATERPSAGLGPARADAGGCDCRRPRPAPGPGCRARLGVPDPRPARRGRWHRVPGKRCAGRFPGAAAGPELIPDRRRSAGPGRPVGLDRHGRRGLSGDLVGARPPPANGPRGTGPGIRPRGGRLAPPVDRRHLLPPGPAPPADPGPPAAGDRFRRPALAGGGGGWLAAAGAGPFGPPGGDRLRLLLPAAAAGLERMPAARDPRSLARLPAGAQSSTVIPSRAAFTSTPVDSLSWAASSQGWARHMVIPK